jgi:HlyD family secretion protein
MSFRLRPSVEILRTGPHSFVLWDRERDLHYEIAAEERLLLHLLSQDLSRDDLSREWQSRFGRDLSPRQVAEFVENLRRESLVEGAPVSVPEQRPSEPGTSWDLITSERHPVGLNLFFDILAALVAWTLNPLCLVGVAILALLGANVLFRDGGGILDDLRAVGLQYPMAVVFSLSFLQTIVMLNLPHALYEGAIARALGGRIESVGIYFWRGFLPLAHVNTGVSLWLMNERDQRRFLIADALFPLTLGSIYLIGWAMAARHSGLHIFFAFMIAPCLISFFLVQCNPFIAQSGYFGLCRWLGDWRLCQRAQGETWAWLGMRRSPEAVTDRERFWLRAYGLGYYGTRLALSVSLLGLMLIYVVPGRGATDPTVYLFGGVVAVSVFQGLGRWLMPERVSWFLRGGGRWYIRWPIRLAVLGGIVACGFIPYKHEVGGNFRLMPAHEYTLRAQIPSEVSEVRIKPGDSVTPDSIVAVLHAREQRKNVETTRHELDEAMARLDLTVAGFRREQVEQALQETEMYRSRVEFQEREFARQEKLYEQRQSTDAKYEQARYDLDSARRQLAAAEEKLGLLQNGSREEEIRAQQANVERLKAQLAHYETELKLADIMAPSEGTLVAVRVPARPGQYVFPGDLIAVLDDVSQLEVEIFATEDAAVLVEPGQRVNLRMPGYREGELLTATVRDKSASAIHRDEIDVDAYRSDREFLSKARMLRNEDRYVRIFATLDVVPPNLTPYMTGYARIEIKDELLWEAVARPIVRFARTEIWSWLP